MQAIKLVQRKWEALGATCCAAGREGDGGGDVTGIRFRRGQTMTVPEYWNEEDVDAVLAEVLEL